MTIKSKVSAILSIAITCQLLLFAACGSDEPSAEEVTTKALISNAKPWKVQSVSVDGTDQTDVYTGLTITFTETGFTASNGGPVWPASGSWDFKDATAKEILRSDGLVIAITEATETRLVLKLTWSKTTLGQKKGGRLASISGENTFTLVH